MHVSTAATTVRKTSDEFDPSAMTTSLADSVIVRGYLSDALRLD